LISGKGPYRVDADTPNNPRRRRSLLPRGESMVASAGLSLAAILLASLGGAAWWSHREAHLAADAGRAEQVRAVGEVLAQSAEAMLAAGELGDLKSLVSVAARRYDLAACRVVLPDGKVIADADASKINARTLPQTWDGSAPVAVNQQDQRGVTLGFPLQVTGRGAASLQMNAVFAAPSWTSWETQAGVAAAGAAGLVGLLGVYRRMRRRLRALGAIGEALLSAGGGEKTAGALEVSAALGAEAAAWNQLLSETEALRKQLVAERAGQSLRSRRDGKSDLDGACDAMWQGLVLVNEHLKISYVNGAAAVFLGGKREELVGADVAGFMTDPRVLDVVKGVATGAARRRVSVEVERREEDNGRGSAGEGAAGVLRFSVRPVRRDDSAAAMVIIEDVTQQRVADEARNAFVAQATHELRTPLTNIRLYIEQALEEGENDPQLRAKALNVISLESRRLERIVGDMLSVAEIEAGTLKLRAGDVRLDALFRDLEADYQAQAKEKSLKLVFELPPKLPVLQGDRDKITLALHNLIGNALKYTPSGGQVTVRVHTPPEGLSVEVSDTGIGIKDDEAELIFEKFYRAKDRRIADITGSGLGLALARDVARMHGGDVVVQSQIDKGSTFTLTLPAIPNGPGAAVRAAA
jgi:PAS domain S-box-containing protein